METTYFFLILGALFYAIKIEDSLGKAAGNLNARYIFSSYSLANPVARPRGISLAIHLNS